MIRCYLTEEICDVFGVPPGFLICADDTLGVIMQPFLLRPSRAG